MQLCFIWFRDSCCWGVCCHPNTMNVTGKLLAMLKGSKKWHLKNSTAKCLSLENCQTSLSTVTGNYFLPKAKLGKAVHGDVCWLSWVNMGLFREQTLAARCFLMPSFQCCVGTFKIMAVAGHGGHVFSIDCGKGKSGTDLRRSLHSNITHKLHTADKFW